MKWLAVVKRMLKGVPALLPDYLPEVGDLLTITSDFGYHHHASLSCFWCQSVGGGPESYISYEKIDTKCIYIVEELDRPARTLKLRFFDKDEQFGLLTCKYYPSLERFLFTAVFQKLGDGNVN